MLPHPVIKFIHKRLGLKNLADFIESRQTMLGLVNLDIRTVLDIGANKGRRARNFRKLFPDATIYCIEPIPVMCRVLERWARTQCGKVKVIELALSSAPSEASFFISKRKTIWSTLREPPPDKAAEFDEIKVRVGTLNQLAEELDLKGDVLIKIDAEGLDLEIIRGGKHMLQRASAVIAETAFYRGAFGDDGPTFEDFMAELGALGYIYRGNVRSAYTRGTPMVADMLYVRREAAERMTAVVRPKAGASVNKRIENSSNEMEDIDGMKDARRTLGSNI